MNWETGIPDGKKWGICATLYKRSRRSGLKRLFFETSSQSEVENIMAELPGAPAYWLAPYPIRRRRIR